jgi:hypothetical protein
VGPEFFRIDIIRPHFLALRSCDVTVCQAARARGGVAYKGKPAAEGGSTAGLLTQCTYKYGFGKVALQDVGL